MRDCIDEDTLEELVLGRVEESLLPEIFEHLLACEYCVDQLEDAREFAVTMRAALQIAADDGESAKSDSTNRPALAPSLTQIVKTRFSLR
jgi:hypothetical protein